MFGIAHLGTAGLRVARRLLPPSLRNPVAWRRPIRRRPVRTRLFLEPLEDRTLLSVSLSGTIFGDLHGTGTRTTDDPTVRAAVAFLDTNQNGKLDQNADLKFSGPTTLASSNPIGGTLGVTDPLPVAGVAGTIASFKVNLDLGKTAAGPVFVALLSPAGFAAQTGPDLFILNPGSANGNHVSFAGTIADAAATGAALPVVPTVGGTGAPANVTGAFHPTTFKGGGVDDTANAFSNPANLIYNGNPNGGWRLLFYGLSGAWNLNGLTINSWSVEFTGSELSTTTDASGNYSFSDLVPATYNVTAVSSSQGPNPSRPVPVTATNQPVTGADLGITPLPDLAATSFHTRSSPGADWGSDVTVTYTIANRGPGNAAASQAEILLSPDSVIDSSDATTATPPIFVPVPALAAGASSTGSVAFHLPGAPGAPPAGFSTVDQAFLGLIVNPGTVVPESNTSNDANQGAGIDLAPAVSFGDQAVTSSTAAQIEPAVAVDPLNSQHLVMAYTDLSLGSGGYGGIGVAESTNGGASWHVSSVPLPASVNPPGAAHSGAGHASVAFQLVKQSNGTTISRPFIGFMAVTYLGPNDPGLLYPSAGAGPDGNQMRSYGMESDNGIFVAGSDDGGLTWNPPVAVAAPNLWGGNPSAKVPFDALPALAIDTFASTPSGATNAKFGTLYVTWTRAYPKGGYSASPAAPNVAGTDILLAVSTDGQNWAVKTRAAINSTTHKADPTVQVPVLRGQTGSGTTLTDDNDTTTTEGGGIYNFAQATVAPTGTLFVGYQEGSRFRWVASTNSGTSIALFSALTTNGEPFTSDSATNNAPNYGSAPLLPFRNFPVRNLAADPTRPGVLYAVEVIQTKSSDGIEIDQGDVYFARSVNNGSSWQRLFTVGGSYGNLNSYPASDLSHYRTSVNDDNGSSLLRQTPASAAAGQVTSLQAVPRLFVDRQGDILIAWYDSRNDPSGKKFDIFAAVSTDGGQTFSPNFRLTDTSIDPTVGAFADPADGLNDNVSLGDFLGVTAAGGVGYVAWTDTRGGTRHIAFTRFALAAPPAAGNDRFEPNDTPATAADLGTIAGQQTFPRLVAAGGDLDYYKVTPGASGTFLVTVNATQSLVLQAYDASGHTLLAQGASLFDAYGNPIGQQLLLQNVAANQPVLIEVSDVAPGAASVPYSLTFFALTQDFGAAVTGSTSATLPANGTALYALTAPVTGTVQVQFSGPANANGVADLSLNVLNDKGTTVLQTGQVQNGVATATVTVTAGQVILLRVINTNASSARSFTLQFNVRDQYQAPQVTSLLLPVEGSAPVALAVGNLNADNRPDIVAVNTDLIAPVNVLLNDGTGLFGAPQTFDGGTGSSNLPGGGTRSVLLADFNNDHTLDVAMTNFQSADVTVLPGRGDGTLQSDHRSDAVPFPGTFVAADFNTDGKQDLAVFPVTTAIGVAPEVAILLGQGDGTFKPPVLLQTDLPSGTTYGVVGDFNGDGKADLAAFSANGVQFDVFFGNGNGTFAPLVSGTGPVLPRALAAVDLNGDGKTDLLVGSSGTGTVSVLLSNGDGTFTLAQTVNANTDPAGLSSNVIGFAVADMGTVDAGGNSQLGLPDGSLDLVAVTRPLIGSGLPQVNLLALRPAAPGAFAGFGRATQLATGNFNGAVATGDFNGDGRNDIALVDGAFVRVLYSQPLNVAPNATRQTARNLGTVTHVVTPTQVIAPGFLDAYFNVTVPTEVAQGAGDEVVDISAVFGNQAGPGLQLEVLDAQGNVVTPLQDSAGAGGRRVRVLVPQGSVLTLHVVAATDVNGNRGAGTYTLAVDVLPQVASVEAHALLPGVNGQPGGPVTTLVLTLQGDRLDPATAENAANYNITWAGTDGILGTADDRVVPLVGANGQGVVYAPDANTVVSSGRTFPTAVRQTITLFFGAPLQAGSYRIALSPSIQSAPFSPGESGALFGGAAFAEHPVVAVVNVQVLGGQPVKQVVNGPTVTAVGLVQQAGPLGDLGTIVNGTSFLTQFHGNEGALLSSLQTALGDAADAITTAMNNQILAAFAPGAGNVSFLIIWLDPVSIGLEDPTGARSTYSLPNGTLNNNIARAFIEVGGNIQVIVLASVAGTFTLNVSDVQGSARGGAVLIGAGHVQTVALTDALRANTRTFEFTVAAQVSSSGGSTGGGGESGAGDSGSGAGSTVASGAGGASSTSSRTTTAAGSTVAANTPQTSANDGTPTPNAPGGSATPTNVPAGSPGAGNPTVVAQTGGTVQPPGTNVVTATPAGSGASTGSSVVNTSVAAVQNLSLLTVATLASLGLQVPGFTLQGQAVAVGTTNSTVPNNSGNDPSVVSPPSPGGEQSGRRPLTLDELLRQWEDLERAGVVNPNSPLAEYLRALIRSMQSSLNPPGNGNRVAEAQDTVPGQDGSGFFNEMDELSVDDWRADAPAENLYALLSAAVFAAGFTRDWWEDEPERRKRPRSPCRSI